MPMALRACTEHCLARARPLRPAPCSQLGLGDDKARWAPRCLQGYTIIHPDRTLRRNRKPVLKTLLLPADSPSGRSTRGRTASQ